MVLIPARPVNGGRLDLAPPKIGEWACEPKFNGHRIEAPTDSWSLFNRHQQPLSGAEVFAPAVKLLKSYTWDFAVQVDAEGMRVRHTVATGTLIVLDYIAPTATRLRETYDDRRKRLEGMGIPEAPLDPRQWKCNTVYLTPSFRGVDPLAVYLRLQAMNELCGAPFYEGVVMKLQNSKYPFTHSPTKECSFWNKHRFDTDTLK